MAFKDLVPFGRGWSSAGRRRLPSVLDAEEQPFAAFQRQAERLMNLMEDFRSGFGFEPALGRSFSPKIDMSEDRESIRIKAELPGLTDKDVELTVTDDALTIRGEKKESEEGEGKEGHFFECSYGMFQRVIPLPTKVDSDKIDALFRNGVLNITLTKTAEAQRAAKRIPIKS